MLSEQVLHVHVHVLCTCYYPSLSFILYRCIIPPFLSHLHVSSVIWFSGHVVLLLEYLELKPEVVDGYGVLTGIVL